MTDLAKLFPQVFDCLSSYDPQRISMGLSTVTSLFARMCLDTSLSKNYEAGGRASEKITNYTPAFPCTSDPLFLEFLQYQDGFQYNLGCKLLQVLEKLLSRSETQDNSQIGKISLTCLSLLQGVLLLHPESRTLFEQSPNIVLLLDLLTLPEYDCKEQNIYQKRIYIAAIDTLVCATVDQFSILRVFEKKDGLGTVAALFREKRDNYSDHTVKKKILEFLAFYILDEYEPYGENKENIHGTGSHQLFNTNSVPLQAISLQNKGLVNRKDDPKQMHDGKEQLRTRAEKIKMLGQYFGNVEKLVEAVDELKPFDF